ncbi:RagB/SusD family nutrient uptake outer membrane protein [Neolewinella antarctica]|uniref:RagB/SusD family nutrient uptake outer membrane protein n=1 Tax=Neolewinella antarctica TaxID=442734 RepID=A0ABX0X8Q2_9BACT|nr:RagB/SusD family nutrient uptake outer membrane protein [Neolewinella antarctica]NJC25630.1 hypothetical protein [Neolewinella antarctica]
MYQPIKLAMRALLRFSTILCTCGLALLSTSCVDSFLDREPISEVTEGNFFQTGADAEAALVAAYDALQSEYYIFDRFTNGDVISDNCYAGGDNPNNFQLDQFEVATNNGTVERDWGYLYEAIGRANAVIDNVGEISAADLTEARKSEILGEARFLRATHYFQLVNLWGGVPLVLEKVNSTDPEVVFQPRVSEAAIYAAMIVDLEIAMDLLPATWSSRAERATKGAAQATLAKAYAHQPAPDWNAVKLHAEAVIDGNVYSLLNNFNSLWDGTDENSAESIFEVQYIGGTNEANWGPQLWLPPSLTGDNWRKFNTPSNDLLTAFASTSDDARERASILKEANLPWNDPDYPTGVIPFPFKQRRAGGFSSPNNFILLRLADVILLAAEANAELNNLDLAKNQLNQVRRRVGLGDITTNDQNTLKTAIQRERRLELAFEGHRWFDLKRTGRAIEVMNALNRGYDVTEQKLLLPIPQSEIDRNPSLIQNPGY